MATSVKGTANPISKTKSAASDAVNRLPFIPENAEEKIDELVSAVSETSRRYFKQSRQYVKQNPGTGLAVATAVGFIAGTLFSAVFRRND